MSLASEGQNRWTALLSIDMVGFSAITNGIGSEAAAELLEKFQTTAGACVTDCGGTVVDRAGDGLLAVFGAPVSLENAALEACRAALMFRDAITGDAPEYRETFGLVPEFRAGVTGGPSTIVPAGDNSIKVVGPAVNEAARIQAQASADVILISDGIRSEAEADMTTANGRQLDIKGYRDPATVFELRTVDAPHAATRQFPQAGLSALVSRETELATAQAVLNGAHKGRVLAITGPAGIGKSRLVHEISSAGEDGAAFLIAQCSQSDTRRPFAPILELIGQAAGGDVNEPVHVSLERLQALFPGKISQADADIFNPDSTAQADDPQTRALRTREALLSILSGINHNTGTMFVVEDLHWIDTGSEDILATLAGLDLPLIVTARPEYQASWLNLSGVTQLTLAPLGREHVARIIGSVFEQKVSPNLQTRIADRSEGNPLLAEELCRAIRHSDALQETDQGFDLPADEPLLLTGRLEHLVMGRVDDLPANERRALQYAAVLGRDFDVQTLTKVADAGDEFGDSAQNSGLIENRGGMNWRFRHALFRDAIYSSLLSKRRQEIHREITAALEANLPPTGENWGELAAHFEAGGQVARAMPYLIRSAGRLLDAYALEDAGLTCEQIFAHLEKDAELIDHDGFCDFAVIWLQTLDNKGNFGRIHGVAPKLLPRIEAQGYSRALGIAHTLTALALTHTRDYEQAEKLAQGARDQAQDNGDELGAAWAKMALMRIWDETNGRARSEIERLAGEIDPVAKAAGDRHLAISAQYLLSSSYRSSGQRLKALAVADQIEDYAQKHNDRRARVAGQWARALIYAIEGNLDLSAEAIRGGTDRAIPGSADHSVCRAIELFTQVQTQPPEALRHELMQFLEFQRKMQDTNLISSMEWTLTALEFRSGNFRIGWRLLNELIVRNKKDKNLIAVRQAYAMRAEVLLSLLGLVDLDSEAPPDRTPHKRKKPGLGDILTALRIRPFARKMAVGDLMACIEIDPIGYGANFARAHIGLGLIAASKRDNKTAQHHLDLGLESARAEGLELLTRRGENALAKL